MAAPGRRVDRAARWGQLTVCLAVLTYGAFAIALPSITIKIQDDMKELGYVYTFYAIGSCCVALAIAVAGRALLRLERGDSLRFLGFSVALIFVVVQSTINWRLSDRLNADLVNNHRLLDTFDGDVPEIKRCAAFEAWSVAPWPDYYRDGMRDGLQETYERYFDEPFCTSLQSVQD